MAINIEDNLPNIQQNGLNTLKPATFGSTVTILVIPLLAALWL